MKTTRCFVGAAALCWCSALTWAQSAPSPAALISAFKAHDAVVAAITSGTETAAVALAKLKAQPALLADPDLNLATNASDVGERLVVAGRETDAAVFFRAAEGSLTNKIGVTPDSAAQEKAQYLARRAFMRARYLGEAALAKADLDAADKLMPNDPYLLSLRRTLASDKAAQFATAP